MIVAPVRARVAFAHGRMDAKFHCSPGVKAGEDIALLKDAGVPTRAVAGDGGLGTVLPTSRTKRVYAAAGEDSVPYLRPYDVFDYLPQPADLLSRSGSPRIEQLMPEPGTILQTCSGRNLGPLAYADEYIGRFAVSDDMLRLRIADESERMYAMAFLSTPTGQALLTRSKTGGVIDHLSAADLGSVEVPFIADVRDRVVTDMRRAVNLREAARLRLDHLVAEYESSIPKPVRSAPMRSGWTQRAASFSDRIDVAYYDPLLREIRARLKEAGGVRVGEVAETFIPGRYKRYYVSPEYGKPIVSGRQLLQAKPVNLRYIAPRSLNYAEFSLEEGMVAFGAEGRAEERIAQPALITSERAGWLANNHVMRVRAKAGVNPGWLYLAFAISQTQAQVKACSCGSVVDTVYPRDLDRVILPPVDDEKGDEAAQAWADLSSANEYERRAVDSLETAIKRCVGEFL